MTRVSIDVSAVPEKPAGAGRFIVETVSRLSKYDDLDIVLLARKTDESRWQQIAPDCELHPVVPNSRPLRLVWEQAKMPTLLAGLQPDVHWGPHYTIPERATVPCIATVHDTTFFDHPEWHERVKVPIFRRAITVATKKADALVAVSDDTARRLQSRFGKLNVVTIPLGVDHDMFSPIDSGDKGRLDSHGIRGRYVAFVGTIEPRKDLPTLVKAFDRVAKTDAELRLVVVGGDGWGVEAYDAAVATAENRNRIVRPGYLPNDVLPALLRQARVVAYPSLAEGFGLPALEALAAGAALVTTRGTPMAEFVEDAAVLVDPGAVGQLTEAIQRLLDDENLTQRLQQRGPEVAAKFTWNATAAAHAELFRTYG